MTKKVAITSRDISLRRATIAVSLLVAGLLGGTLLGRVAVGSELLAGAGREPDFASLSSNPDALVADPVPPLPPCYGCADSYGVAERMRAAREQDGEAYRALGEVDYDASMPDEPADDYRYGGRFPDTQIEQASLAPQVQRPVAVPEPADAPAPRDDEITTLVANPTPQ